MRLFIIFLITIVVLAFLSDTSLSPFVNQAFPWIVLVFTIYAVYKVAKVISRRSTGSSTGSSGSSSTTPGAFAQGFEWILKKANWALGWIVGFALLFAVMLFPTKWFIAWIVDTSDAIMASTESRTVVSPTPIGQGELERSIVFEETLEGQKIYTAFRVELNHQFRFVTLDRPILCRVRQNGNEKFETIVPSRAGLVMKATRRGVLEVMADSQARVRIVRLPYSVWRNRPSVRSVQL